MKLQNQEQIKAEHGQPTEVSNKPKKKWSNRTWLLVGIGAAMLGFVLARLWVTFGTCIPCWLENNLPRDVFIWLRNVGLPI